jgi:hypothetical protein
MRTATVMAARSAKLVATDATPIGWDASEAPYNTEAQSREPPLPLRSARGPLSAGSSFSGARGLALLQVLNIPCQPEFKKLGGNAEMR